MPSTQVKKRRGGGLGNLFTLPLFAAGAWIAYSRFGIDHQVPLPDAILAERKPFLSQVAGWLNTYVDREAGGRPLVLVHSVNAAASAYEMGPLFRHYRSRRPVVALDLPGYGFSDRSPREYTPELFARAILELLEGQVGEQADVVGLSLGCEFVARAALMKPELFHSLVLISPSGFNQYDTGRASQRAGMRGNADKVHAVLSFPLWGRALFDLIASKPSIDYFLKQSFAGEPTPGFADYGYATAHQPGAEHVPLHFVSGRLFTPNAAEVLYENLRTPTLAIYDQDAYVSFDTLPTLLERNPRWRARRIAPTRGLPHFEKLEETAAALDEFWDGLTE